MENKDLKPCPFCGGEAEIGRIGSRHSSMIYRCTECGCMLETSEDAVSLMNGHLLWNYRVNTWQPIETAPKDDNILGCYDYEVVAEIYYNTDRKSFLTAGSDIKMPFSHWMPLPEPPESEE